MSGYAALVAAFFIAKPDNFNFAISAPDAAVRGSKKSDGWRGLDRFESWRHRLMRPAPNQQERDTQ